MARHDRLIFHRKGCAHRRRPRLHMGRKAAMVIIGGADGRGLYVAVNVRCSKCIWHA